MTETTDTPFEPEEPIQPGNNFPPKPTEQPKHNVIGRSIMSLVLFVAAFYFIFKWDLVFIALIAVVLIIHELGHFLAMKIYRYKDLSIFFIPLIGAAASGTKEEISQTQNAIILLAGPLPGIVIGIILFFISRQNPDPFLYKIAILFVVLNLFNLLPVYPLDGGRLLKTLFFEKNEIISQVFTWLSMIVIAVYAVQSKTYTLLIIPFFALLGLKTRKEMNIVNEQAEASGINLQKPYADISGEEYWKLRDIIGENMTYYKRMIEPGHYYETIHEQKIINQVKSLLIPSRVQDVNITGKLLFSLTWIAAFAAPLLIYFYYKT